MTVSIHQCADIMCERVVLICRVECVFLNMLRVHSVIVLCTMRSVQKKGNMNRILFYDPESVGPSSLHFHRLTLNTNHTVKDTVVRLCPLRSSPLLSISLLASDLSPLSTSLSLHVPFPSTLHSPIPYYSR